MKAFSWILFDADETLFHFDAYAGLQLMFKGYGVDFTLEHYQVYQALNQPLWLQYQSAEISAKQLQEQRFSYWGQQLNVAPSVLNSGFLQAMAEVCTPLPGAVSLLNALQGKAKLGIITNGFTDLQQIRLERTGLHNHFDILVISEQVGAAKPHPQIFTHAKELMGLPDPASVLMVGDNPIADIGGGKQAGFYTCWLNRFDATLPAGITADLEVQSLEQLETALSTFL
ncbi:pyrimidine 5'-nucleotidase [Rheinheimera soli]|uniref:YjjG family noncanonical pyrimidine nucleotidase n=1 Tax=Rheinheimera soli TaxID=443616 RepID=A0ABU1W3D9_9GAMM|nr:pyrimidine 5'-nucleotidase [Rheinheimera soli]MDR7122496.1 YjjG family noncanonical pyrimidine nucleotidase [Rheinheimera soli]